MYYKRIKIFAKHEIQSRKVLS